MNSIENAKGILERMTRTVVILHGEPYIGREASLVEEQASKLQTKRTLNLPKSTDQIPMIVYQSQSRPK